MNSTVNQPIEYCQVVALNNDSIITNALSNEFGVFNFNSYNDIKIEYDF